MASGNNSADAVDIGFYGLYDTSGSQDLYGGLFRDAGDSGKWKLFKDNQAAPTTTVNVSGTGYAVATLVADLEGAVTGNADTATALATGRTIGMTGDVVWTSASFTGSGNVTAVATIQAGSVDNAMLAGSITNANLQNSSITLGDASSSIMTISLGQQFSVIGSNGCTTSLDNNILTINTAGAEATGYAAALALG